MQAVHTRIKDYYLASAGQTPEHPNLGELVPLIEAVHHACGARDYDEAHHIRRERIDQVNRYVLHNELGAYETELALVLDFFPGRNTAQEPLGSDPHARSIILNNVGFCLMHLGRLAEAVHFYERGIAMDLSMYDWDNASIGYRNVAELHANRGAIPDSAKAARQALALAQQAQNKREERNSLAYQAWAEHLRGNMQEAGAAFQQAEALERELTPQVQYLYSLRGIQHAEHLRRVGQADYARRITEANLKICRRSRWANSESLCNRVLGDLAVDAGEYQEAQQQYDEALTIARSISQRAILIEALLAQGHFAARKGEEEAARGYLEEALGYAVTGGYRLYEIDIAIALAWAYRAIGDVVTTRAQAERALQLSVEMGYYWGEVDAREVLGVIGGEGGP